MDFGSSLGREGFLSSKLYTLMITPPGHYSVSPLVERRNAIFGIDPSLFSGVINWDLEVELDYITSTTAEVRALSPKKRDCLYHDENILRLFPSYSETNCILECSWEHAAKECGCAPWFLLDAFPTKGMCEAYGNLCFKKVVKQRHEVNYPCKHRCMQDCEKVSYTTMINSEKIIEPSWTWGGGLR